MALGLVVAALGGCTGQGDGQLPPPAPNLQFPGFEVGDVVATLELGAPSVSRFVLHGTVPLPRGLYDPNESASPFVIRGSDGTEWEAQVETVSRYPRPADGADVVEVLAVVDRPSGASHEDRVTYDVVWSPNNPNAPQVDSAVQALLESPDSLVLRTRDVFGNAYSLDLAEDLRTQDAEELVVHRAGPVANTTRGHGNLTPDVPVLGSNGTLAHMMGIHSYITTWRNEGFISLDLRVHNGHQGGEPGTDQDDAMGKLYFEDLELVVPDGWTLFQAYPTPSFGASYVQGAQRVYPIVAPLGGGELHMMPWQAMFHRRFVLCRSGEEAAARSMLGEEGLGFCISGTSSGGRELLSWWNPDSARYYPQNIRLPHFDYLETRAQARQDLADEFDGVRGAHAAGVIGPWPIVVNAMGWAHPWGPNVGNMHGGAEINFWDGAQTAWAASREGYRRFQINHRMCTERHPTALYDSHGKEHQLEDWVAQGSDGPYLPINVFIIPWLLLGDPWGVNSSPSFQRDAVAAQGREPFYDAQLSGFQSIDNQHWVRFTRNPKVLVWLGNDPLSKDDLYLQGELARSSYSFLDQETWGESIVTGAAHDRKFVDAHPGEGFEIDRGEGWLFDTAVAAYALQTPAWRNKAFPWFQDILELVEDGQSDCNGAIMAVPNPAHFSSQYRVLQSISESIVQNGLWGMRSTVFDDIAPGYAARLNTVLEGSTSAMIGPLVWDAGAGAPTFYTALGPYDTEQPAFCNYVPPDGHENIDDVQTWSLFPMGYWITGDPIYITRATEMAGGSLVPEVVGVDTWGFEIPNRVAVLSWMEDL